MVRRVSGLDLNDVDQFVVSGTAGEYVFEKGEAGAEMYIIHEGEVEILRSVGGETRVLTTLEPGDFFGEMSLLEKTPREVSARAVTDCKLLKIDYSTFDQMVQEDPEIAVRMLRKLARRLREQQEADLRAQQVAHQVLAKEESTEEAEAAGDEAGPGAPKASLLHPASGREFLLTSTDETTDTVVLIHPPASAPTSISARSIRSAR